MRQEEKDWKVYDAERLAKFFGVTAETVQEWCRRGKLPAFKVGRDWKVRVADLRKMIERKVRGGGGKYPPAQGLF
jgi:excisionase family DNA binding protein